MSRLLGIETSCDETAAAVVSDGFRIEGERVATQIDLHARFGGVIPEIASRSHLELLFPVIEDALASAGVGLARIDAIAVTTTPGLVGCLLVGLSAAKGLALATGLPLVPVNHVHAHIHGALMPGMQERADRGEDPAPRWPLASLVVSGGHTSLYASRSPTEHKIMARTIDDAAGEAYDKVSALLGLGYPGGPRIDRLAAGGNPRAFPFPRSRPAGLDFSFSGLKTAVRHATHGPNAPRGSPARPDVPKADVAASFQAAVVDVLVERLAAAARRLRARGLVVCGGVAANSALRARAAEAAETLGIPLHLPPLRLATDNAAMIAGLGGHLFARGLVGDLALDVSARAD